MMKSMRHLIKIFVLISVLSMTAPAGAFVPDRSRCFDDLQLHFFREQIVNEALSVYIVPQGLWSPINRDLRAMSVEIPSRMKQISLRMIPNPLEFPIDRFEAAKIFKLALYQVFVKVMRRYYVTEHPTIEEIFDYVFAKEAARLIACFGPEVQELIPEIE